MKSNVNIIDGSNIFFISYGYFQSLKRQDGKEILDKEDVKDFLSIFFMKMKQYLYSKNNIICFEGTDSKKWRKSIYPEYKATRPDFKQDPNYEIMQECSNKVQYFLKYLPCKVIRADNCEGDDCIYTFARAISDKYPLSEIHIISGDEDLTQIQLFFPRNVKVWHPIKKEFRIPNKNIILEKVLVGDKSDNIKYKKGLGPKTFQKMLESIDTWHKYVSTKEDYEKVNSLRKIVDLRYCPVDYQNNAIKVFNNTEWNEPNKDNLKNELDDDSLIYYLENIIDEYNSIFDRHLNELSTFSDREKIENFYRPILNGKIEELDFQKIS